MEEIPCIFCNRSTDNIVIEEEGYKGRKCPTCGLIFISPRPSLDEILKRYRLNQPHTSAKSLISDFVSKKLVAKHHLRIIKKFIRGGSMLEIGAGAGYFLQEARKNGFDVFGIELNDILAKFIIENLGIPCEASPLSDSTFDGKLFDIIYHCDVISHFYDPLLEFEKMNRKLKKGGFVVFETGNLGDIEEKYFKYFVKFQYPDHLFFFSVNNLYELLLRTGFETISIYRFSILPELIINKIMNIMLFVLKRNIAKDSMRAKTRTRSKETFLKKIMRNFYGGFDFLVRYKLGYLFPKRREPQTIIVVARKIPSHGN
jgi:SAM-dependent methyltransferase